MSTICERCGSDNFGPKGCRPCWSVYMREWSERNREKKAAWDKRYREEHGDKISARRKARLEGPEREKILAQKKAHYERHKSSILLKQKVYAERKRAEHPEAWKAKNAARMRRFRAANQEHYRAYAREYMAERLRTSSKARVHALMSRGIRATLKTGKGGRSWLALVDYTIEDLVKRLKRTIPKGYKWVDFMTGKLHIDHKIPVTVFNFTSPDDHDFRRCWSLRNLQLLPEVANKSKGARLERPFQPSLI